MLSNRNKAPDAAASITAISNSLGALHGGGDSSSDSSHSDNGEQDDSGNDNGSGSGDGGDDDWDDRDDADDGDVEEEGEGDDLDLLIVSGEEEKEADEEENENEEEAEEGFGSGGGGDEDEEGCIQRDTEEVADPPVELLEPNAATRHKRRNKRTARGKGSSGERLYRSQCRDYARVEVWRMMKAPVAFFRPQFRSVMLRHIDETAHFGNGEAADTLAAAFLADNEQDWWESLQDKKTTFLTSCVLGWRTTSLAKLCLTPSSNYTVDGRCSVMPTSTAVAGFWARKRRTPRTQPYQTPKRGISCVFG